MRFSCQSRNPNRASISAGLVRLNRPHISRVVLGRSA
jgi:hypothetical protein